MPLKSYDEIAPEALAFPIGGKVYEPPPINVRTGITLVQALSGDPELLAQESRSLWQMLLGATYDEMYADEVPLDAVARAGFAMLVDFQGDRAGAIRVWESGIDPEARAAITAALRTTGSTQSTGTASGRKTPSRASTRATTSRKATKRTAAKPSRGKRS